MTNEFIKIVPSRWYRYNENYSDNCYIRKSTISKVEFFSDILPRSESSNDNGKMFLTDLRGYSTAGGWVTLLSQAQDCPDNSITDSEEFLALQEKIFAEQHAKAEEFLKEHIFN